MANNVSASQSGARTLLLHAQVQLAHLVILLRLVPPAKFKKHPLHHTRHQAVQLQSSVLALGAKRITLPYQLVALQLARVHHAEQDKSAVQEADILRILKMALNVNVNLHGAKQIHRNAHLQHVHQTPSQLAPQAKRRNHQLTTTRHQVALAQVILSLAKVTGVKVLHPLRQLPPTQAALAQAD